MPYFRRKPVEIEAVQWTGANIDEIILFIPKEINPLIFEDTLKIKTLEGMMTASAGDWIIKGVVGEFYPCKPDIFEKTYEEILS